MEGAAQRITPAPPGFRLSRGRWGRATEVTTPRRPQGRSADYDENEMKQTDQLANATADKTRIKQAEARTQQAEARTEQARTRAELAETRTEQAESRTESAKTRTEQAEIRSEQAEAALQRVVHREVNLGRENRSLEQLTGRQRQILQLIAESQNTKQIAEILKVSPKTVEYHRLKLMDSLNVHDIASLVRFALKVGLIPPEN